MQLVREMFPCSGAPKHPEFLCGVEFEIESIEDIPGIVEENFIVETDDSLRNNGREFKTKPNNYENTLWLFDTLHNNLSLGNEPFSDRTSTHVHVNVANLTVVQARELILTYALLEPLFLGFVGPKRQNNIFCVPLNYTHLPGLYRADLPVLVSKWHKYTAFNILPMVELGTVEFRHLYGTDNKLEFSTWLLALKQLFEFVRDTADFSIVDALKAADAASIAQTIVPILTTKYSEKQLNEMMKDTQLDVKLSVGGLKNVL